MCCARGVLGARVGSSCSRSTSAIVFCCLRPARAKQVLMDSERTPAPFPIQSTLVRPLRPATSRARAASRPASRRTVYRR
eukprot:4169103-Prymnesium_polylepis.1